MAEAGVDSNDAGGARFEGVGCDVGVGEGAGGKAGGGRTKSSRRKLTPAGNPVAA